MIGQKVFPIGLITFDNSQIQIDIIFSTLVWDL